MKSLTDTLELAMQVIMTASSIETFGLHLSLMRNICLVSA